jgi:hypothetical protein
LGSPVLDQVFANGAKIGDTLCVYELQASRLGCEVISEGDDQLELYEMSDWKPNLEINPVTSKMFNISVFNLPEGLSLKTRLYSLSDPALPAIPLVWDGSEYKGTILSDVSIPEGYVHLYVEGSDRREMVANYALGGSPGHRWPRFGRRWARFAPAISSDGQAIIFGDNLQFEEGEFFGIQAIMSPPAIPAWTTQIGLAYRLFKSSNAPDLEGTTISFNYLGNQVPPGEEDWVKIYYWTGTEWQDLSTELDLSHNIASAPTQGEGMYALMSTIEIQLHGPGWDLLAYPVNETRTVEEVLQSIDGSYTTVYGYQYSDSFDPWKVYDVSVPDWVNDLVYLEFGRSYWIYLTEEDVILRMRGSGFSSQKQPALPDQLAAIGAPPATFYGSINEPMETMDGETIYAWINNHQCGQGQNMTVDGQEVYSVNVFAEGSGDSEGCGIKGRTVIFQVGTQPNAGEATWDNNQLWELNLSAVIDDDIFLPLIFRFP